MPYRLTVSLEEIGATSAPLYTKKFSTPFRSLNYAKRTVDVIVNHAVDYMEEARETTNKESGT